MEEKEEPSGASVDFSKVVKKAYDTGRNDQNITVKKIIETLIDDLIKLKTH